MKKENAIKGMNVKGFVLLGLAIIALMGILFASSGMSGARLLSQFSGNTITPATASSLWQPSTDNPAKSKLGTYTPRVDTIIRSTLSRGSSLTGEQYQLYLDTLIGGIINMKNKTEYAGNQDVQNIVEYIIFELKETKNIFANVQANGFFGDYTNLVNQAVTLSKGNSITCTPANGCCAPGFRAENGNCVSINTNSGSDIAGTSATNPACSSTTIDGFSVPSGSENQVKVVSKIVGNTNYEQEFKCFASSGWTKRGDVIISGGTSITTDVANTASVTIRGSIFGRTVEYYTCGSDNKGLKQIAHYDKDSWKTGAIGYNTTSYSSCSYCAQSSSSKSNTMCGEVTFLQSTEDGTDRTISLPTDRVTIEVTKTQVNPIGEYISLYGYIPTGNHCRIEYFTIKSSGGQSVGGSFSIPFLVDKTSTIAINCANATNNKSFTFNDGTSSATITPTTTTTSTTITPTTTTTSTTITPTTTSTTITPTTTSNATCPAGGPENWMTNCRGSWGVTAHGTTQTVINTNPGYTGEYKASCKNGIYTLVSQTCTVATSTASGVPYTSIQTSISTVLNNKTLSESEQAKQIYDAMEQNRVTVTDVVFAFKNTSTPFTENDVNVFLAKRIH